VTDSPVPRIKKAVEFYAGLGWKILPCHGIVGGRCTCGKAHAEPKDVGKHPAINEWNTQSTDDYAVVDRWWDANPDYNAGIHCAKSGLLVIDIDPRSGGPESFLRFEELIEGALPPTVEAITGSYTTRDGQVLRGRHIFYRCDPEEALVGNLNKMGLKGVDIKHNGYVLVAPSHHFSGVEYEWVPGKEPWVVDVAEASEELLNAIRKRGKGGSYSLGTGDWGWVNSGPTVDLDTLLKDGIEEGSRAVDIYRASCALANKYGTDDQSRQMIETMMIRFNAEKVRPPLPIEGQGGLLSHVHRAIDFVAANPKVGVMDPHAAEWMKNRARELVESSPVTASRDTGGVLTSPTRGPIMTPPPVEVSVDGPDSVNEATKLSNLDVPKDPDSLDEEDGGDVGRRSLSDTGNGRRIVDRFGWGIRYSTGLGWFVWEGGYWRPDPEGLALQELAKRIPPIISADIEHYPESQHADVIRWAHQSRFNARLRGAIDSARSDPRVEVPVEMWDRDDHLLGVLNGVIDLKTGELLKGRPDLYITKRAPVAYTSGHRNVRWEQFLDFATGGDTEYKDWLQRAAGYSITGSNKLDVMFLVYGPPGSGKNTFVEAIVKALGTKHYSWPLDSVVLAQGDGGMNSTDMYHWAEIRGKRIVWVDELPDSERLKENQVKKITGSSEIPARSPGGRPFNFDSKAKLWISTNHRPVITDDAMWRRIRPMPFTYIPERPDPDLKEFIFDPEGALPAVLAWAVEGAVKVLNSSGRDPLGTCARVEEASEIYRSTEDRLGIFLSERTTEEDGMTVSVKSLYDSYRPWAEGRGEKPLNQTNFQRRLADRNLRIEGLGESAVVFGRSLKHVAPVGAELDFAALSRFARII
jgi:P4 family phage/plasmid primase-like protien